MKDRPRLKKLIDLLTRPPDTIPLHRTWGEYTRDAFIWALKIFIIFCIRGC